MKKVAKLMVFLLLFCQIIYAADISQKKPQITQFFSNEDIIAEDEIAKLSWSVFGAPDGCEILEVNTTTDTLLVDNLPNFGLLCVKPGKTKKYQLICRNENFTVSKNITILVENAFWHKFKRGATHWEDMLTHFVFDLAFLPAFSYLIIIFLKVVYQDGLTKYNTFIKKTTFGG